mgnify:CR=1 FL=1
MSKELVFGHQKPDTDAITAAMAFSYFRNEAGYERKPLPWANQTMKRSTL